MQYSRTNVSATDTSRGSSQTLLLSLEAERGPPSLVLPAGIAANVAIILATNRIDGRFSFYESESSILVTNWKPDKE
jgi:hypothetical protein